MAQNSYFILAFFTLSQLSQNAFFKHVFQEICLSAI